MPGILIIVQKAFSKLYVFEAYHFVSLAAYGATGLWRGVHKSLQDDDKVIEFSWGPLFCLPV